jgi:plastocyanin
MMTRLFVLAPFVLGALMGCSSAGTAASSTTGGTTTDPYNGCTEATAEDHTNDASATIKFGGAQGNSYSPSCVVIGKNHAIIWEGDFTSHFLVGGTADENGEHPDDMSDIKKVDTGTMAQVNFRLAGDYPFYCQQHGQVGMRGCIFVK